MKREEQIERASEEYIDHAENILEDSVDSDWEYVKKAFKAGAEWADKHIDINIVSLLAFEAAEEPIVSKLQSLIKEWSHNDSSEGKYRLEAYKELLEFIKE